MGNEQYSREQLAVLSITELLEEFGKRIRVGTSSADTFLTLDEIEGYWLQLCHDTDRIYSDMLGEIISTIDEKELIRKKKDGGLSGELN